MAFFVKSKRKAYFWNKIPNDHVTFSIIRHDARRPLPSTRDTLRMLQKKREGAHHSPQQRGMSKVQSGPLRADHNIQAVRKDER